MGRTLHGGDNRLWTAPHSQIQPPNAALHAQQHAHRALVKTPATVDQIKTRAEMFTRAFQNHNADVVSAHQITEDFKKRIDHGPAECIAYLGSIQCKCHLGALLIDKHGTVGGG